VRNLSSSVKVEESHHSALMVAFFIMLVTFHQSACCLIPEDRIFIFTAVTISDLTSHSSLSVVKTAGLHGFLFTVILSFSTLPLDLC